MVFMTRDVKRTLSAAQQALNSLGSFLCNLTEPLPPASLSSYLGHPFLAPLAQLTLALREQSLLLAKEQDDLAAYFTMKTKPSRRNLHIFPLSNYYGLDLESPPKLVCEGNVAMSRGGTFRK